MRRRHVWRACARLLCPIAQCRDDLEEADARESTRMSPAGKPLVAHVVVALCDNEYQGIVPVPATLGDGEDPAVESYWGAMYGVRSYFRGSAGLADPWPIAPSSDPRVLERSCSSATSA